MNPELGNLSPGQLALLDRWLPGASVERDHGWGVVETTVLEMTHAGSRFIVKAGGESDHHIAREIHAHLNWLGRWTSTGRAPAFEYGDLAAKLLVTRHLPGNLVLGSEYADLPSTYRQAGELLAVFHAQTTGTDRDRRVADAGGDPRSDPRGLAASELAGPRRSRERDRLRSCSDASRDDRLRPAGRSGSPPRPRTRGTLTAICSRRRRRVERLRRSGVRPAPVRG